MYIEERQRYQAACHIDRRDMKQNGITMNDLIQRTPLGHMFLRKLFEQVKQASSYPWPDCAATVQLELYEDKVIVIVSERIEEYLYQLKETTAALAEEQANGLQQLIDLIEAQPDEKQKWEIIKSFEHEIRQAQKSLT